MLELDGISGNMVVSKVEQPSSEAKIHTDPLGMGKNRQLVRSNVTTSPEKAATITVHMPIMSDNLEMEKWFEQGMNFDGMPTDCEACKTNGVIHYLNDKNDIVKSLEFEGALPKSRKRQESDSKEGAITIDIIQFEVERYKWSRS
ncbi:hypothetical protein [Rivularia sp. UHCC 0363]|uniref:hypothetical protein n=1 Tax=Rivularia sp. UHCC 0363 TaxID=3110244 RepID=UPI002B1F51C3|nr:hypothetical protein [Rivularia sp. UHCC 0363]MEA5598420.1 hypothetical protein [Rivularia sp. UHCC 0363]